MSHENIARRLKAACIAAMLAGTAAFLLWAWSFIRADPGTVPGIDAFSRPAALWACGIGALCCLSLLRFWGVCGRIGEDRSFCLENVTAMRQIARFLWIASGMSAALAALLAALRALAGAGILHESLFLPVFLAGLFAGVALLSKALSLLLAKAVDLQADHDLTV